MAPGKTRSLADQLADLEDPTPKDFDPEDIERDDHSSDGEAAKPSDSSAGREHYQAVGKGKLRKQDPIALGKQYAGTRVSRDALDAESDDDPFATRTSGDQSSESESSQEDLEASLDSDSGSEIDGEDLGEELGEEPFDDEPDEGTDHAESESGDSEEEVPDESSADELDDGSAGVRRPPHQKINGIGHSDAGRNSGAGSDDREELRKLMASDQKTITATISQAAKADATKGKAVKEQRTTFDALLNTRIKLQKGLSAMNEVSAVVATGEKDVAGSVEEDEAADAEAIKSAESAALTLWSTLEELRTALADAHVKDESKKRKRTSPATPATTSASLWERMSELESDSLVHRRAILDKWSSKVRGTATSLPNARGKLLGSASGQQTITALLDAHVATELGDRSSKRARHIASSQDSSSAEANEPVYDDTVFYQSLLRDLVEQRMSSTDAIVGGLDQLHRLPSRLPIHPITGMRNDKEKRDVDTRASKGRKMRFNVHEKLQNFMAPEDRGGWSARARDEFFASLLGKTASGLLGEEDDSGSDEETDDDREEGGLRLFRN
ncbi:Protein bfr2 [Penicillium hispanicum]|uniref:Protein bfr2 n=1 Tax=Penicillium hispanicum TaxID=1080232 RepID=UPI00253FF9E4|nr:Protein bfr2 [Penicillium hispanicum]KAJ5569464.1 Protein bfr2 [Penicillium hispanicum]